MQSLPCLVLISPIFPLQILHSHISSLEKLPLTAAGSPLKIKCKTFLIVTFVVARERDCHDVYEALLQLSNPGNCELIFTDTIRFHAYK